MVPPSSTDLVSRDLVSRDLVSPDPVRPGLVSADLVSVIVPAFNAEVFIEETVRSVLAQRHERLELIVVDDGSTDGTAGRVASLADPRLVLVQQENQGVTRARNAGLRRARGSAVAFLDADDLWDPEKIGRQLPILASDPALVAVGCIMVYRSKNGRRLGRAGREVGIAEQRSIEAGRLMPFPISSALLRTEAVRQIGGFDESFDAGERIQAEDLDFLARLARLGAVVTVPIALGSYRVHSGGVSARQFSAQRAATRFVRARIEARATGGDLAWREFRETYRPSARQRYGDAVQSLYRRAGLYAAERRWFGAIATGALAAALGPAYTLRRARQQLRVR